MDVQLPFLVRLGGYPPGVIIDATFALSPVGLLVTMALSRSANVWLPRGLYTLLDNDAHYRLRPEQIGGSWLLPEEQTGLAETLVGELEPWRRAWQNGRLSSRVHWVGDAPYESAFPIREDNSLLPRFEGCCAALDARLSDFGAPAAPLDECARDVVALAAALQPNSAYILTAAADADDMPPLCVYLERLGFAIRRRPPGIADGALTALGPALAPMAASGQQAAVVQIVAPVILAMPDGWEESEWALDDDPAINSAEDPWRNACALWRPLAGWAEVAA
ncbi:hypothetical protein [Rhizobium sp. 768_B6_N1_8]|uniref:hypothetical protein n=1 Tax=unclassified Rhizobium TaxID=2613769 RepID=UPI003F1FED28